VLEFLGLQEKASYSESELESAIVTHIENFGKGFLFEARQKQFTFDEEHFFVDLVLYNRLLHCYCAHRLKIGKLLTRTSARCRCTSVRLGSVRYVPNIALAGRPNCSAKTIHA